MNAQNPTSTAFGHLARPVPDNSIAATTRLQATIVPRTDRAGDLAVVTDHYGQNRARDEYVMARVFRRFGFGMLGDEALAMLADEYEAAEAFAERINAENRKARAALQARSEMGARS